MQIRFLTILFMRLLGIDTESGGIGLDYSLLTVNLSVLNDNFDIIDQLDIAVKPNPINNRSAYFIQAEALQVNNINLVEHDKIAVPYKDGATIIYNWLDDAFHKYGKFTPFGQNIQRDIDLITKCTLSPLAWENFVDVRVIDTIVLGKFAQLVGVIPETQSLSLSKITRYLGIEVDSALLHTAQYDVALNAKYFKMVSGKR